VEGKLRDTSRQDLCGSRGRTVRVRRWTNGKRRFDENSRGMRRDKLVRVTRSQVSALSSECEECSVKEYLTRRSESREIWKARKRDSYYSCEWKTRMRRAARSRTQISGILICLEKILIEYYFALAYPRAEKMHLFTLEIAIARTEIAIIAKRFRKENECTSRRISPLTLSMVCAT